MFEFRKTNYQQRQSVLLRAWIAGIIALIGILLLAGRLWFLQVVKYENLSARAEQNRITIVPIPPRRGQIVDRNNIILAHNQRDYTWVVTKAQVIGDQLFGRAWVVLELSLYGFARHAQTSSRT